MSQMSIQIATIVISLFFFLSAAQNNGYRRASDFKSSVNNLFSARDRFLSSYDGYICYKIFRRRDVDSEVSKSYSNDCFAFCYNSKESFFRWIKECSVKARSRRHVNYNDSNDHYRSNVAKLNVMSNDQNKNETMLLEFQNQMTDQFNDGISYENKTELLLQHERDQNNATVFTQPINKYNNSNDNEFKKIHHMYTDITHVLNQSSSKLHFPTANHSYVLNNYKKDCNQTGQNHFPNYRNVSEYDLNLPNATTVRNQTDFGYENYTQNSSVFSQPSEINPAQQHYLPAQHSDDTNQNKTNSFNSTVSAEACNAQVEKEKHKQNTLLEQPNVQMNSSRHEAIQQRKKDKLTKVTTNSTCNQIINNILKSKVLQAALIVAPMRPCPPGRRRDKNGVCRRVYA